MKIIEMISTTTELVQNVKDWAKSRKLTTKKKQNKLAQALYIGSEYGEFREKYDKDGLGDTLVTIINLATLLDVDVTNVYISLFIENKLGNLDKESSLNFSVVYGKLADAVLKDKEVNYTALIGELVTALLAETNLDPVESLQEAYNVISKRTGKTVGGVYIKDETSEETSEETLEETVDEEEEEIVDEDDIFSMEL